MITSLDDAIQLLDEQTCPICRTDTAPVIEHDEDRVIAAEVCENNHRWPYSKFSEDRSTNAFEGEFDPIEIDERLDAYSS